MAFLDRLHARWGERGAHIATLLDTVRGGSGGGGSATTSTTVRSDGLPLDRVCAELSDTVRNDASRVLRALDEFGAVLLVGAPGIGKSLLARAIASSPTPTSSSVEALCAALDHSPAPASVVLLEDVHAVQAEGTAALLLLLRRAIRRAVERGVHVLGVAGNVGDVHPELVGAFALVHRMCAPTRMERELLLARLLVTSAPGSPSETEAAYVAQWAAQRTGGWTRADIAAFVRCWQAMGAVSADADLGVALAKARRNVALYKSPWIDHHHQGSGGWEAAADTPDAWQRTHGEFARVLDTCVVAQFAASPGATATNGVLLHGPAGNGKTTLALALGRRLERLGLGNFVSVRCSDLVSRVVGETEQNVARMFAQARDASPCLIFLDQIETLAPNREGADVTTTERTFERVLSVLLVELDGVLRKRANQDEDQDPLNAANKVVLVAATQRMRDLDAAMIRPGRLGVHVLVGPPSSPDQVLAVLQTHCASMPLSPGVNLLAMAQSLVGSSRATIAGICREAGLIALRNNINACVVTERDFAQALERVGMM